MTYDEYQAVLKFLTAMDTRLDTHSKFLPFLAIQDAHLVIAWMRARASMMLDETVGEEP